MNKIVSIAFMFFIISSVFLTGCVSSSIGTDPIVGIWKPENITNYATNTMVYNYPDMVSEFYNNGTYQTSHGMYRIISGHAVNGSGPANDNPISMGIWKNLGNGTYSVTVNSLNGTKLPSYLILNLTFYLKGNYLYPPNDSNINDRLVRA